ncbi:unnamed protein product [Dicrocoelium dendriticum]|nr:unnamed protein product [Dicrocoelium dendriticum]
MSRHKQATQDEPRVLTFRELNKKRKVRLPPSLRSVYEEGLAQLKSRRRPNDPRFDPRVNGLCVAKDWEFITEEGKIARKKLQKMLKTTLDPVMQQKIKKALHLLRQRDATYKDREFRSKLMRELQESQMSQLQAGKRVKFLTRAELRRKLKEERMKNMNRKQRVKYLQRQERKRPLSSELSDTV